VQRLIAVVVEGMERRGGQQEKVREIKRRVKRR
jgi:hypothetical protein